MALGLALSVTVAHAAVGVFKQERVPGGTLELPWLPGFGVGRSFTPLVLPSTDPASPNPSGDNTVAVLQNVETNLGGIAATATDPGGVANYCWEADFFTGAGDTRRGLLVRADPSNGFQTFYQFVINAGLFVLRFRKFVNGAPQVPDLMSWTANLLPGGIPAQNTWHHMMVVAKGDIFRCYFDGFPLPGTNPDTQNHAGEIQDPASPILTGWVGAYNFSASVGEVPVYFDNLTLCSGCATPVRSKTWGELKQLYR